MKFNKNIFQMVILVITAVSMIATILTIFNDFDVFTKFDSNILLALISSMVVSVTVIYVTMIIQRVNPKKYIYVSFSSSDKEIADLIISTLENRFKTLSKYRFSLLTADSMPYGSEMSKTMQNYLTKADIVILVISSGYIESDWCNKEFNRIIQLHKKIIPIVTSSFNDLSKLPTNLSDIKALSLINCKQSEMEERLTALAKDLIKQRKD